jgi:hypothetical protein
VYEAGETGATATNECLMADIIKSIMDYFAAQKPQVVAQDRYMRTPITQGQQISGAGASYDPASDSISAAGPLENLPYGILAHEIVHGIYNKANLAQSASNLSPLLSKLTSNYIKESPLYNQMGNAGSPEQLSNEGLSFSATSPVMLDKQYVDAAAAQIKDPKLKQTLMRLYNNRLHSENIN